MSFGWSLDFFTKTKEKTPQKNSAMLGPDYGLGFGFCLYTLRAPLLYESAVCQSLQTNDERV